MKWVNITGLCTEYRFSAGNYFIYVETIQVRKKFESCEISAAFDRAV